MTSRIARFAMRIRARYAAFLTDACNVHRRSEDIIVGASPDDAARFGWETLSPGVYRRGKARTGYASLGNAISLSEAYRAASAIVRAEDRGLECVIEDEDRPWDGDCDPPRYHLQMWIPDPDNCEHRYSLASLGGIGINSWDDPYLDILKGELFAEALTELDARADREAESAARELESRATYAAGHGA